MLGSALPAGRTRAATNQGMDRDRVRRVQITDILTHSGNLSGQLMTGSQGIARWQSTAHYQLIRAAEPRRPHAN